jgi:hypothetical protein
MYSEESEREAGVRFADGYCPVKAEPVKAEPADVFHQVLTIVPYVEVAQWGRRSPDAAFSFGEHG